MGSKGRWLNAEMMWRDRLREETRSGIWFWREEIRPSVLERLAVIRSDMVDSSSDIMVAAPPATAAVVG